MKKKNSLVPGYKILALTSVISIIYFFKKSVRTTENSQQTSSADKNNFMKATFLKYPLKTNKSKQFGLSNDSNLDKLNNRYWAKTF